MIKKIIQIIGKLLILGCWCGGIVYIGINFIYIEKYYRLTSFSEICIFLTGSFVLIFLFFLGVWFLFIPLIIFEDPFILVKAEMNLEEVRNILKINGFSFKKETEDCYMFRKSFWGNNLIFLKKHSQNNCQLIMRNSTKRLFTFNIR